MVEVRKTDAFAAWLDGLRDAGLSRESLYKALSGDRSPEFDPILKVVGALGLRLHAKTAES
jgi:probable addiction module antidote protein